jgi:hypothetical protein
VPHISYSELKHWSECTWRHKLLYIDKVQGFQGNEHTSFGTAVHETVEQMLLGNINNPYEHFDKIFTEQLKDVGVEESPLSVQMRQEVNGIFELIIPSLDEYFSDKGGWSLVATEEALKEPVTESRISGYEFKGFIDLVIKDGNGHFHVIDWKTCSWGWHARKKNNPVFTRQLVYYKHYYSKKFGINLRAISTHFGLIKRTAKKNRIELVRVTSGERKTKNSLDFLDKALYNITNKRYIKNRLSCKYCPFHETEHCP